MIDEIKIDIFKADTQAIIHSCNCQCCFGSGIARSIREFFPEAYEADCKTKRGDYSKMGRVSVAPIVSKGGHPNLKFILNLYGQYMFGHDKRHTSYDALADGFERIMKFAVAENIAVLSVPFRLGSNKGGGNWSIVKSIIYSVFEDDPIVTMNICENPALTGEQICNTVSK